jgi:Stage II sporulation protein E (SpoIIE)
MGGWDGGEPLPVCRYNPAHALLRPRRLGRRGGNVVHGLPPNPVANWPCRAILCVPARPGNLINQVYRNDDGRDQGDDHEFGEERLLSCLQANRELPASQLLECLLNDVRQFTVGAEQSDDLTVLVLRYLGA